MERDDLDELGPIDYLVVEFPGSQMTGKGPAPARPPEPADDMDA
jgi:hypothetical protein